MWHFKFICVAFIIVRVTSDEANGSKDAYRRVFGGTNFKITDAPYMALFFRSDDAFQCGASIVHQQYLVSAAHCYNAGTQYYIKVGTDKIDGGERYEIEKIILHPKYTANIVFINDVSVIKLKRKLKYSDRVRPITLAPINLVLKHGMMLETMGFGVTEISGSSPHLLRVTVPYVDVTECNSILEFSLTPSMMCAGGVAGEDTCRGDSGGPLIYNNMLVGIVSFGIGCGEDWPAVYARVSYTRDFIDRTIRVNSWPNWPWWWM